VNYPVAGPNPYEVLGRLLGKPRKQQLNLLRLKVWCERNKCAPILVYEVREGILVQCRSDANVSHMQEDHPNLAPWSKRRAFFVEEWMEHPGSHLSVVCDCNQTNPRLVDVARVVDLLPAPGSPTRNVSLPQVCRSAPVA